MYPAIRESMFAVLVVLICVSWLVAAEADDALVLSVPAKAAPLHVTIDLPAGVSVDSAAQWELSEAGGSNVSAIVDILPGFNSDGTATEGRSRLAATIVPREGAEGMRRFMLKERRSEPSEMSPVFRWVEASSASLRLDEGDRPVFTYNHGDITNESVPAKDARRTRGCYLHPIFGLDGEVLTDDFPRDHYHHHGLFWAWPHVEIDGEHYDLWMGRNIRQRFVRWLGKEGGVRAGTIGVENGWFVGDRKVMIERVWLTAHQAIDDARAVDLTLVLIPVDRAITLRGAEGKSYGGPCIRFNIPRREKPTITVPSGVTEADLSMTRLAWVDLAYGFAGEDSPSGASLMISKTHPDYPPTWLTRHYGPQCIGYPGVESKTFEPGEPITLRYRLWIHRGVVELEGLSDAYDAYTSGEEVAWEAGDRRGGRR